MFERDYVAELFGEKKPEAEVDLVGLYATGGEEALTVEQELPLDTDNILREQTDVGTYEDLDLTEGLDIQQAIKPEELEPDVSLRFNAPEHYEPEVDQVSGEETGNYIERETT